MMKLYSMIFFIIVSLFQYANATEMIKGDFDRFENFTLKFKNNSSDRTLTIDNVEPKCMFGEDKQPIILKAGDKHNESFSDSNSGDCIAKNKSIEWNISSDDGDSCSIELDHYYNDTGWYVFFHKKSECANFNISATCDESNCLDYTVRFYPDTDSINIALNIIKNDPPPPPLPPYCDDCFDPPCPSGWKIGGFGGGGCCPRHAIC
ncbi:hypothetical protein J8V57_14420 [Xenorhabdus sp. PB61.4]|uniref:hypothetical protein n=1 Tax=Xenorhabdus sp. PB61.4 TaxID=2788940 RepID=UPI001E2E2D23|nr:hypothetical protein [Xenorhabdus sp. PB61.4]MCC8367450.1 hypothetical protein [Xenorhabdus sp. PB61.4]